MSLETSYDVLEMLRDDGVQTFRAKEKSTGRGLELHLFLPFGRPENKTLFEKLKSLPLDARKNFLDIGFDGSTPYLVTDPLAGGIGFKNWADQLIAGSQPASSGFNPSILNSAPSRDDGVQILQAGQWKTGTPIPDSLITKPPTVAAKPVPVSQPKAAPADTGDFTRMFKAPDFLNAPEPPAAAGPPPSEFTGLFQSQQPAKPPTTQVTQEMNPPVGEFTGLFQPAKTAPAPLQATPTTPPPYVAPVQPVAPPVAPEPSGGEFTRMFQAPAAAPSYAPPPPAQPPPTQPTYSQAPYTQPSAPSGGAEFTKYFENPLKPAPMGSPQPMIEMPPPPPPTGGPRAGEFTDIFGRPSGPSAGSPGGFSFDSPPPQPPPPGPVFGASPSATGAFSAQPSWSQPQAQPTFGSGPSEYTKMMNAQQMSAAPAPSVFNSQPSTGAAPQAAKKSNTVLFIVLGVVAVLAIAVVVYLVMRSGVTIPGAK